MSDVKYRFSHAPDQKVTPYSTDSITPQEPFTVLVLNSNRDMANEIASQLAAHVDECSIMYAPTLETGRLLIRKRKIDLIVSSPVLPDGHITRLQPLLESISSPPDVVIFADRDKRGVSLFESSAYQFVSVRQVQSSDRENTIASSSRELRDALNNPLQEIVALVYLARQATCSRATSQALESIEHAAQRMAGIVWELEEKLYRNMLVRATK